MQMVFRQHREELRIKASTECQFSMFLMCSPDTHTHAQLGLMCFCDYMVSQVAFA